jgi:iron complex outermembrane receptor protein
MTLAGRFDHYSDFGSTFNPKLSVRWQPMPELVVRSALSTGFRAPSLYELYSGQAYTNTGTTTDPLTCPGGPGSGSNSAPNYCKDQFVALNGGNTNLKPEKSKTFTLGFVSEPVKDLSFGADYWFIQLKDQINFLDFETILDPSNQSWSTAYVHRNPAGTLSDITQLCPGTNCGYVDSRYQNLGGTLTDGVDWNAAWRTRTDAGQFALAYNSTWVRRYSYQDYKNGPWNRNVGVYVGASPVFRWHHEISATWKKDAYSAGILLHAKSGYIDDPNGEFPGLKIGNFITADIYGGWEVLKGLNLTLGIRNLTDKAPPLSGQINVFQAGYDPRFYDPTGRVFYGRLSYNFDFK